MRKYGLIYLNHPTSHIRSPVYFSSLAAEQRAALIAALVHLVCFYHVTFLCFVNYFCLIFRLSSPVVYINYLINSNELIPCLFIGTHNDDGIGMIFSPCVLCDAVKKWQCMMKKNSKYRDFRNLTQVKTY